MLDVQQNYARRERYLVSETKTNILAVCSSESDSKWTLNDTKIAEVKEVTHLGIHRDNSSKLGTNLIVDENSSMLIH